MESNDETPISPNPGDQIDDHKAGNPQNISENRECSCFGFLLFFFDLN
jgi:hypothetical protein